MISIEMNIGKVTKYISSEETNSSYFALIRFISNGAGFLLFYDAKLHGACSSP